MTWGLSKLSPVAPVFFCPALGAPSQPGRRSGWGVGFLEHRRGLGGSWAGKLSLNQRDMQCFFLLALESEMGGLSPPSLPANQDAERSPDKGGMETLVKGPIGSFFFPGLQQSSVPFYIFTRYHFSR